MEMKAYLPTKGAVTLEDVAREAGVSTSSVSRFLSGNVRVSDKRGARIAEAIARLNYQPNTAARTLASGKSATIGILTQDVSSSFFGELVKGVEEELSASGYACIITSIELNPLSDRACLDLLLARQVDGVIVMGHALSGKALGEYVDKVPLVVIGQELKGKRCVSLFSDYYDLAREATLHLVRLGHTRIGYFGGFKKHPDVISRIKGYRRALEESGIDFDPALVEYGNMLAEGGASAVARMLDKGVAFTALFAANDENALGARLELYRRGLSVPGDVSLIGFDDLPAASLMIPPLTTVRQPMAEGGRLAARAMIALLSGKEFNECLPPLAFIQRESTAPPATQRQEAGENAKPRS